MPRFSLNSFYGNGAAKFRNLKFFSKTTPTRDVVVAAVPAAILERFYFGTPVAQSPTRSACQHVIGQDDHRDHCEFQRHTVPIGAYMAPDDAPPLPSKPDVAALSNRRNVRRSVAMQTTFSAEKPLHQFVTADFKMGGHVIKNSGQCSHFKRIVIRES